MTTAARPLASPLAARLTAVVAAVLRVPETLVTPDTPFTMLGMDSLGAVELTAAIGDALGVELDPNAVHEYPDLASLSCFIDTGASEPVAVNLVARMRRDAILPDDIAPNGRHARRTDDARNVLVTGATGFVGAYLVRALLDESTATVTCLVRGTDGSAGRRVERNMARYGVWSASDADRLRIVRADLARPLLGLLPGDFAALATDVDAIFHGGASVNWVHGYDGLRAANVVGTREILRLACTGTPKPLHFLSSLAVCHSTRGPRVVDESADMLSVADGLHLGYAQSKCVAESLVRAAGARGLPVTITRPSLVTGDSQFGRSNPDDLVSRFIAGCIRLGAAPDLDWRMDFVPVDFAARAVVGLARAHGDGLTVAHLASPRPRHWRECVLWMRLWGYDLELLPYREWAGRLRDTRDVRNPLHALRSFFLRELPTEGHLTLPELNEESRRSAVSSVASARRLRHLGAQCPSVDAHLLDRYFADFVEAGAIAPAPSRPPARSQGRAAPSLTDMLPRLAASLAARWSDPSLSIDGVAVLPFDTDDSIVAELTSWRHGTGAGLYRAVVEVRGYPTTPSRIEVIVKAKAADQHVLDVGESVARLAGPAVGDAYAEFREWLGFTRCHLRELALYSHTDSRLRRHTPAALSVHRDDDAARWIVVLEKIDEVRASSVTEGSAPWSAAHLDVVLRGLAEIHTVWYERDTELLVEPWLAPARDAARLAEMTPLWVALADHAAAQAPAWRDDALARIHRDLAAHVSAWAAPAAGLPRTLIHNDFNPRNFTIRDGVVRRLCAYDWELATISLPQRDLAEVLCFTLSPEVSPAEVARWIERYRTLLVLATGHRIESGGWRLGFRAAMAELLVDRLAMYAMVDRFRPQRFLGRVTQAWLAIWRNC